MPRRWQGTARDPYREPVSSSRGRREFAVSAVAVAVGGGLAVLANSRAWDQITVTRAAPLGSVSVAVSGRTIVPGVTGLAVVALAGVVALLATRGRARVVMGVLLTATGALLAWQASTGFGAVSQSRGRELVAEARTGVVLAGSQRLAISASTRWPLLALLGALLVIAGGVLVTVRGVGWASMSARYESPAAAVELVRPDPGDGPADGGDDPEVIRAKADLAMWQSLERGEDPTLDGDFTPSGEPADKGGERLDGDHAVGLDPTP
ncbi:MAG: Trp biosynthesis associated, transrane protein Oprn/Chp [Pseudonocardiales bacterium]|nr:Trp biosynthesis associated, transrane protein Oprn/Chp [Pseudonocardiales bacterium]